MSSALLICSLLYMPLLSASFKALDCYERPIDGVTYLRADLRVPCNTGSHVAIQMLAWSVIVGLGVGFPATICWALLRRRAHSSTRPSAKHASQPVGTLSSPSLDPGAVWRPLYEGYGPRTPWWEAVILLRKAMLALIGSQLGGGTRGIACFAVVLVACVVLQESVLPYDEPRYNTSERLVLLGALATAVLALLYSSEGPSSPSNSAVTAAVLILTLLVLLLLTVRLAQAIRCSLARAAARQRLCLRFTLRPLARETALRNKPSPLRLRRDRPASSVRNVVSGNPRGSSKQTQTPLTSAVAAGTLAASASGRGDRTTFSRTVDSGRPSYVVEQQWHVNPVRTTTAATAVEGEGIEHRHSSHGLVNDPANVVGEEATSRLSCDEKGSQGPPWHSEQNQRLSARLAFPAARTGANNLPQELKP
jgi:hypothetical protein